MIERIAGGDILKAKCVVKKRACGIEEVFEETGCDFICNTAIFEFLDSKICSRVVADGKKYGNYASWGLGFEPAPILDFDNGRGNAEFLGAYTYLILHGEITDTLKDKRNVWRMALGLTAQGELIAICGEYTTADLAQTLKEQGCVNAINLDGSDSAQYISAHGKRITARKVPAFLCLWLKKKEENNLKYFNQNDYTNAPYPSSAYPTATIKTGGCGVCTAANVLRFFGINSTPPALAQEFIAKGARVAQGTDMEKAAEIICEKGGLAYRKSDDLQDLLEHLNGGGIAIANVDGDSGAKGIFSNSGHYINVVGNDNTPPKPIICFDVGYYAGKFGDIYRKKYVSVAKDKDGNTIQFTTLDALKIDTAGRKPRFYLFSKKEILEMTKDEAKKIVKEKCGLSDETIQYIADDYRWGDDLILKIAKAVM